MHVIVRGRCVHFLGFVQTDIHTCTCPALYLGALAPRQKEKEEEGRRFLRCIIGLSNTSTSLSGQTSPTLKMARSGTIVPVAT